MSSFLYIFRETDAKVIFRDAASLNMTGAGYVWIVTEQALDAPNAPEGLLGLKLINASAEKAHIKDSLSVLLRSHTIGTNLHVYA